MSTELAKLHNNELVYGTHAEVEAYAVSKDTVVDNYLNYVAPSTVQSHFKYVGNKLCDPYSIPRPIYKYDEDGTFIGMQTFKEKF